MTIDNDKRQTQNTTTLQLYNFNSRTLQLYNSRSLELCNEDKHKDPKDRDKTLPIEYLAPVEFFREVLQGQAMVHMVHVRRIASSRDTTLKEFLG
jgi:hypothetical protein